MFLALRYSSSDWPPSDPLSNGRALLSSGSKSTMKLVIMGTGHAACVKFCWSECVKDGTRKEFGEV